MLCIMLILLLWTLTLKFLWLLQIQYAQQHLVRLLQIIVDGNCDMAVRQVASIHFKNFVSKAWSPIDPGMWRVVAEHCFPSFFPITNTIFHFCRRNTNNSRS